MQSWLMHIRVCRGACACARQAVPAWHPVNPQPQPHPRPAFKRSNAARQAPCTGWPSPTCTSSCTTRPRAPSTCAPPRCWGPPGAGLGTACQQGASCFPAASPGVGWGGERGGVALCAPCGTLFLPAHPPVMSLGRGGARRTMRANPVVVARRGGRCVAQHTISQHKPGTHVPDTWRSPLWLGPCMPAGRAGRVGQTRHTRCTHCQHACHPIRRLRCLTSAPRSPKLFSGLRNHPKLGYLQVAQLWARRCGAPSLEPPRRDIHGAGREQSWCRGLGRAATILAGGGRGGEGLPVLGV